MEGELKKNIPETDLDEYIIIHYRHLLTLREEAANRHYITSEKAENAGQEFGDRILEKWGTKDPETLELLGEGYDEFRKKVVQRILREEQEKVVINNCPECGKLARTPQAKQCRFCCHDWH